MKMLTFALKLFMHFCVIAKTALVFDLRIFRDNMFFDESFIPIPNNKKIV